GLLASAESFPAPATEGGTPSGARCRLAPRSLLEARRRAAQRTRHPPLVATAARPIRVFAPRLMKQLLHPTAQLGIDGGRSVVRRGDDRFAHEHHDRFPTPQAE